MGWEVNTAAVYTGFRNMKRLGAVPIEGMLVLRSVTPSVKLTVHVYTPECREAYRWRTAFYFCNFVLVCQLSATFWDTRLGSRVCCSSERNSITPLFFPLVWLMILNSSTFWFSYCTELTSELVYGVNQYCVKCCIVLPGGVKAATHKMLRSTLKCVQALTKITKAPTANYN